MSDAASNSLATPWMERDGSPKRVCGGGVLTMKPDPPQDRRVSLNERLRGELESLLDRVEERAMDSRLSLEAARRYADEARALRARLRLEAELATTPGETG